MWCTTEICSFSITQFLALLLPTEIFRVCIPEYLALLLACTYMVINPLITQRHGLDYINRDYHASMWSLKSQNPQRFRYKVHTICVCWLSILPYFLLYPCFSLIHKSCFCGLLLVVLYMVSTFVS